MNSWEAALLGLIEGLTEYLPVSSTGHLLIAQNLLGIGTESHEAWRAANAFAICIQAGAILAVLSLYAKHVVRMVAGVLGFVGLRKPDPIGFRMARNVVVAFTPAAVIGLLFDDLIESYLFGVWPIVASWFVGGVVILIVTGRKASTQAREIASSEELSAKADEIADDEGKMPRGLDAMTWQMALIIGFVQCIAMWPGTSRSLVTIVGGVVVGLSLAAAVEFSFLLGVLTLCAATVYKAFLDKVDTNGDGVKDVMMAIHMQRTYGWQPLLIGSLVAWVSAMVAVKWMVSYLKKHGMAIFGYYRIAIALITTALVLAGAMAATQPWE